MSDARTTGDQPKVPFTLQAHKTSHLNGPRIIEALVIAAVSAMGSSLLTTARLEERLKAMESQQQRTEQRLERMQTDMYRPRWQGQAMVVPNVEHSK